MTGTGEGGGDGEAAATGRIDRRKLLKMTGLAVLALSSPPSSIAAWEGGLRDIVLPRIVHNPRIISPRWNSQTGLHDIAWVNLAKDPDAKRWLHQQQVGVIALLQERLRELLEEPGAPRRQPAVAFLTGVDQNDGSQSARVGELGTPNDLGVIDTGIVAMYGVAFRIGSGDTQATVGYTENGGFHDLGLTTCRLYFQGDLATMAEKFNVPVIDGERVQ